MFLGMCVFEVVEFFGFGIGVGVRVGWVSVVGFELWVS